METILFIVSLIATLALTITVLYLLKVIHRLEIEKESQKQIANIFKADTEYLFKTIAESSNVTDVRIFLRSRYEIFIARRNKLLE